MANNSRLTVSARNAKIINDLAEQKGLSVDTVISHMLNNGGFKYVSSLPDYEEED